jgi:cyd operon protein YbgT
MWYFSWVLGLGLAVMLGVLNGIWHEFDAQPARVAVRPDAQPPYR